MVETIERAELPSEGRKPSGSIDQYRVPARDKSNPGKEPLQDAQRAIGLVRHHATEWNIKPDRIGIMGFSAGGSVVLTAAIRHDAGKPDATDPIERVSSRPDFFAPIYTGGFARYDAEITKEKVPPCFMVCAYDDSMPEAMAGFLSTLHKAGVNAELHIYNSGGHGFGVRERPMAVTGWSTRFIEWLGDRGFTK